MSSNYQLLIQKINEFTHRFYLNKLLRGLIYTATALLALFLLIFLWTYYAHPGVLLKTIIFYAFIIVSLTAIAWWVVKPALAYFRISKNLSIEEAAELIGNHFFNVKDKLLNTLQLKALADKSPQSNQLILAGIDQKITELKPIPFSSAIRLKDNKKYLKYIIGPSSIILLIAIIAPSILKEGTYSFVKYDTEILPKAPFDFQLANRSLRVVQGEDFRVDLRLTGDQLPQEVYISEGLNTYKLEKQNKTTFQHTFKNIQSKKNIRFNAGGFNSVQYTIEVVPRPSLLSMSAFFQYPGYLNKKNEELANVSDIVVPKGTIVTWKFRSENSSNIVFVHDQQINNVNIKSNSSTYKAVIVKTGQYKIFPENGFAKAIDSLQHQITVIEDQFPSITVAEKGDSLSSKVLYFTGTISDDYGFSSLKFKSLIKENGKLKKSLTVPIAIRKNQSENTFFYYWDLKEMRVTPGQVVEYYFEVADNDGVNGPKATKSAAKLFAIPTAHQIAEKIDNQSSSLKQKMQQTIRLASAVEKESEKLSESLLDKKQLSVDDKKQIEQLLNKQKELENAVKEIQEMNEKTSFNKEESQLLKEDLAEKQKQIDNLFNKVLDEKTKSLLEKLQQLMDQNNKSQTQNELSKVQMDNKSLKKELDRILELYKQLEFEQNLQNNIDRLDKLAQEQKDLSKQTKNNNGSPQELIAKQQDLTRQFQELQDELQRLEEKNQSLERPNSFDKQEKEGDQIEQEQKESEQQLEEKSNQKAAQNQQQAAENMQEMAKKMREMQDQSSETENNVNAMELRKLLENLLTTSFDQERVMLTLKRLNANDPLYTTNMHKQRVIKDNMKTISDSLYALSKRVPQIETAVNDEMQKINFNADKSLEELGERRTAEANKYQQYTMTSVNNLALMLNEALEQMQNMMKNAKGGGKGKKQSMQQLQQMQEQLNKNMQQARDQIQKSGNNGAVPKGQMSEQFAKMAQQQQMIREALQKINQQDNKDGKGQLGNLNQVIKEMKMTESDLVNKRLLQETINRQKEVLTKLLDAENAQREQDQDSKRESKSGKEYPPSYRKMLEEYEKSKKTESEWLQKLPPDLNYYYKNRIAEYFKLLNSQP